MLKRGLIALAILFLALIVVIAMQPNAFQVARSASIAAPAPVVFSQINDLRSWEAWSPWAERDPEIKRTYEGPPSGTGAVFKWSGNHEVGVGKMTIVESRENEFVRIRLEFLEPFAATNTADFTLRPAGEGTEVTWAMHGKKNFMAKAVGFFMDIDEKIGNDFEQGLASLEAVAEAQAKK